MSADKHYARVVSALNLAKNGKLPPSIAETAMSAATSLYGLASRSEESGDTSDDATLDSEPDWEPPLRRSSSSGTKGDIANTVQALMEALLK